MSSSKQTVNKFLWEWLLPFICLWERLVLYRPPSQNSQTNTNKDGAINRPSGRTNMHKYNIRDPWRSSTSVSSFHRICWNKMSILSVRVSLRDTLPHFSIRWFATTYVRAKIWICKYLAHLMKIIWIVAGEQCHCAMATSGERAWN